MKILNTFFKLALCIAFVAAHPHTANSQIFLQIEKFNSPKTIKFVEGDQFEFRLHAYPKTWRTGVLEQILIEEETIVLDGDFFQLDELKDIRIYRPWANTLGRSLIQFSVAWFGYALILDAFNIESLFGEDFSIGPDTLIIGGSAFGLGIFIRKVFGRKKFKLGRNSRLRLVDIRF